MRTFQLLAVAAGLATCVASAQAVPVSFTPLTGLTGGTLAATGVYRADLSGTGLNSILSITIGDNSAGLGGAAGQFSGFDLDAIKLSTTNCDTAACAQALAGISVFDFGAGTIFSPGVQRAPTDPKLFGTNVTGTGVDNVVATLGVFDGEATTVIPGAFGFLSLGDTGQISFNLTAAVNTAGLFLYIGEVGDNGEVAAGNIRVSDNRVPLPGTLSLAAAGLLALASRRRKT
jgi:hypothetical protein